MATLAARRQTFRPQLLPFLSAPLLWRRDCMSVAVSGYLLLVLSRFAAQELCLCTDVPPSLRFTCAQQRSFGKCNEPWMTQPRQELGLPDGFCQTTCGRCTCPTTQSCVCDDVEPPGGFTCEEQRDFGKCQEPWMRQTSNALPNGFCARTCGRCACPSEPSPPEPQTVGGADCPCTDIPPSSPEGYSCEDQRDFGKCTVDWMRQPRPDAPDGYCQWTCGFCDCPGAPELNTIELPVFVGDEPCNCSDVPPNSEFTCLEQRELGKCLADWMRNPPEREEGFCQITCGFCPCSDPNIVGPAPERLPSFPQLSPGEQIPISFTFSTPLRMQMVTPSAETLVLPLEPVPEPEEEVLVSPSPRLVSVPELEPEVETRAELLPLETLFSDLLRLQDRFARVASEQVREDVDAFYDDSDVADLTSTIRTSIQDLLGVGITEPLPEPEAEPEMELVPEPEPEIEPEAEIALQDLLPVEVMDGIVQEGEQEVEDSVDALYTDFNLSSLADVVHSTLDQATAVRIEPAPEPEGEPLDEIRSIDIVSDLSPVRDEALSEGDEEIEEELDRLYDEADLSDFAALVQQAIRDAISEPVVPEPEPDVEPTLEEEPTMEPDISPAEEPSLSLESMTMMEVFVPAPEEEEVDINDLLEDIFAGAADLSRFNASDVEEEFESIYNELDIDEFIEDLLARTGRVLVEPAPEAEMPTVPPEPPSSPIIPERPFMPPFVEEPIDQEPAPEPDERDIDMFIDEIRRSLDDGLQYNLDRLDEELDMIYREAEEPIATADLLRGLFPTLAQIQEPAPEREVVTTEVMPSPVSPTPQPAVAESLIPVTETGVPTAEDVPPSPVSPAMAPVPEPVEPETDTAPPRPSPTTPVQFSRTEADEILLQLNVRAQNISDSEDVLPLLSEVRNLDAETIEQPELGALPPGRGRRLESQHRMTPEIFSLNKEGHLQIECQSQ